MSQDAGRLTAVKCLVETADEGDELAIEACLRVSEDLDATIRLEAVQVRHDRRLRQSRAKNIYPDHYNLIARHAYAKWHIRSISTAFCA